MGGPLIFRVPAIDRFKERAKWSCNAAASSMALREAGPANDVLDDDDERRCRPNPVGNEDMVKAGGQGRVTRRCTLFLRHSLETVPTAQR